MKHVLSIFSDRVVASLKLQGSSETAEFVQFVLNWRNSMNVSEKGQDLRMRDPNRAPQTAASTNLQSFLKQFKASESGHGPKRVRCLTHDTRRALLFKPQKGSFPCVCIYFPLALSMFYLENSRATASKENFQYTDNLQGPMH